MVMLKKYSFPIFLILFLLAHHICLSQCPENVSDFVIRTQQDWDHYTSNYPDCNEWNIFMVDNKFIGYPKPEVYLIQLFGILTFLLLCLKIVFKRLGWN